jgi:hypothetical protein
VPHDSPDDAPWFSQEWSLNLVIDTPDGDVAKAFGVSNDEPLYVAVSTADTVMFRYAGLIGSDVIVQLSEQVAATATNTTVTAATSAPTATSTSAP